MSTSLIVLRFETADDSPSLKHIEYKSSKILKGQQGVGREASPSDFPYLKTERLLSIHRGNRVPVKLCITTLEEHHIIEVLTGENKEFAESLFCMDLQPTDGSEASGESIRRCSSKESTPGAGSSKEGTPGPSEDGSRRGRSSHKDRISFVSGNPMVEVTHGILHLFKENDKTSLAEGYERSEMLCMLAVPSSMTVHALLQFIAPCYQHINFLRIIRDTSPNQYMILLKFINQSEADLFYSNFNGHRYNTIETDVCNLVYVANVETTKESENGGLAIPGHTELPTCPVCLERMDETLEGILTILCNHSFHGSCLAKWGDTSCPVCRYCQIPEETPDQRCLLCGSFDSLWICLICGHVGCGRYVGGHAYRHFQETNHLFSMQVGNNRVWDYVRDNYVHRLLQSEGDGKVVSYEPSSPVPESKEDLVQGDEKLTALQLEYTHLLSSQLESQRQFFEDRTAEAQAEALAQAEEAKEASRQLLIEVEKLRQELSVTQREKQNQEKKIQHMSQKVSKLTKDLETEEQLNLSMREGKQEWVTKVVNLEITVQEKDNKIIELQSQVSDIMAHMEALSTVSCNEELQGGGLVIGTDNGKTKGARRKQRK